MCPRARAPFKLILEVQVQGSITLYTPTHFTFCSDTWFIKNRQEALEVCRLKQCHVIFLSFNLLDAFLRIFGDCCRLAISHVSLMPNPRKESSSKIKKSQC